MIYLSYAAIFVGGSTVGAMMVLLGHPGFGTFIVIMAFILNVLIYERDRSRRS